MRARVKGPEEFWQGQLTYLLDVLGWSWVHVPRSKLITRRRDAEGARIVRNLTVLQGSAAHGYPDLTAFAPRGGRVVFLEAKTDTGRLEPHQRDRCADLAGRGLEVYVARPADLELVRAVLQGSPAELDPDLVMLLTPWWWHKGRRPRGVVGDPRNR